MKRAFYVFIGMLFISSTMTAQEHQISAGIGVVSTNQIVDVFSNTIVGVFSGAELESTGGFGELRIAYAYTPKEKLSYGVAISYNMSEFDLVKNDVKVGERTSSYYTVAGEGTYYYLKNEMLRLYGLLGAGVTFTSFEEQDDSGAKVNEDTDTYFNFQVTPIGISYGRNFGGFAELGFGYRGILSLGLYYRF